MDVCGCRNHTTKAHRKAKRIREEVERGVPADHATVLRGAFSNDYMQGVYGRIEFNP
jgi:hypothetical protein